MGLVSLPQKSQWTGPPYPQHPERFVVPCMPGVVLLSLVLGQSTSALFYHLGEQHCIRSASIHQHRREDSIDINLPRDLAFHILPFNSIMIHNIGDGDLLPNVHRHQHRRLCPTHLYVPCTCLQTIILKIWTRP